MNYFQSVFKHSQYYFTLLPNTLTIFVLCLVSYQGGQDPVIQEDRFSVLLWWKWRLDIEEGWIYDWHSKHLLNGHALCIDP